MKPFEIFQKLQNYPLGKNIFTRVVCHKAPYFKSIKPLITMLTPEECEIRIKKRKSVTNHLGTVHAIAMCNGCELAFGMVMESGLPSSLRWIPKGMTVRYLKKADSDLVVKCSFPEVKNLIAGDHQVPVQIFNNHQEVVMDAMITVYVSERKKN